MAFCKFCGCSVPDAADFCPECGKQVDPKAFCSFCGTRLT